MRQWRYLKMLKRSGRGHSTTGADGTKPGELAVLCPACPQPGKNLPDDWQNAPEDKACVNVFAVDLITENLTSWLYTLFLGGDANFRMVRRSVSNETRDPSLINGGAYFVEQSQYISHLKENSNLPQEVCSSSHNARTAG